MLWAFCQKRREKRTKGVDGIRTPASWVRREYANHYTISFVIKSRVFLWIWTLIRKLLQVWPVRISLHSNYSRKYRVEHSNDKPIKCYWFFKFQRLGQSQYWDEEKLSTVLTSTWPVKNDSVRIHPISFVRLNMNLFYLIYCLNLLFSLFSLMPNKWHKFKNY